MKFAMQIIKEQLVNIHLILRLAIYEVKSKYLMHYLGVFWEFLNPAIQLFVYWFVIGIGIRGGGDINGFPYFIWLLTGIIPWFFLSRSVSQGSSSVFRKVSLVSKMKFPVSVLPTISIISSSFIFLIMLIILFIILAIYGVGIHLTLIQIPYYLISMFVFLFAITLLFSTISVVVRDFQSLLQQGMRVLFYLTPILWDQSLFSPLIQNILRLNPFFYLVNGFRDSLLGTGWFYQDLTYTLYFWSLTLLILFIGATVHIKLRNRFVDYI
ncbi:ABC transporter permease [Metabacillus idriensis]|uniref:ABC transporter permease n=1 Tax=Metabacillus idriensis TaxID=324768 RepID=UPI0028142A55|nr:ABC transporter permease [Metabacillus idriensis]MDR0138831.1 ABC transporter permease [Metabacillus idriensis]